MLELSSDGDRSPRALLRSGGDSVARHQITLVQALGCERVVVLARGLSPDLIALQHLVERQGARFHVVDGPQALLGLVTVADEVIVLADGLFVSVPEIAALLEKGQVVLTQPIERGLAAGFERIDLNSAGAGAMRLPGRLIERLAELPADCDCFSALQRIALQAGVAQRPIPTFTEDRGFWTLVRNEIEAHALEPHWIRQQTRPAGVVTPGEGVALFGVRVFGPALLHAGSGAGVLGAGALLLVILALAAGWFAVPVLGFAMAGLGWIVARGAVLLLGLKRGRTAHSQANRELAMGFGFDALFVALATMAAQAHASQPVWERAFPPLMLVALLHLVPKALGGRIGAWLRDRALLALGLGVSAAAGATDQTVHLAAAVLALAGILVPRGDSGLTRT